MYGCFFLDRFNMLHICYGFADFYIKIYQYFVENMKKIADNILL